MLRFGLNPRSSPFRLDRCGLPHVLPQLVIRGAVPALRVRFPIPLSDPCVRFPAQGIPSIYSLTGSRSLWLANGAQALIEE